uniref:Restriction endonuclease type IV Mrr domain-containing protein n=1 Tax=mine drainage metagenome TaxID=410659 RepID=E6QG15_9ZZZZ
MLIECKHWNDKVSVEAVRNLIGVAVSEQYLPTGVILATTSKFTPDAKKLKINPTIAISVDLKDYEEILNWIGDYDAIRFTSDEIKRYITAKIASQETLPN